MSLPNSLAVQYMEKCIHIILSVYIGKLKPGNYKP